MKKEHILIMVKTRQYSFVWSPEEKLNITDENSGTWDKWRDLNKLCHVWNKMEPIRKLTSMILYMQSSSWYNKWERGSWKKVYWKCTQRNDWPNQKDAIDKDINFLWNREVFGPVVHTLKGVKQVRCKWTVAHKEWSIWN